MVCPFGVPVLERRGRGLCGLVFGTLLGPEATGPGMLRFLAVGFSGFCLFLVSWLHRSRVVAVPLGAAGVWGVWYGVVV